jgi:hypothetical protein
MDEGATFHRWGSEEGEYGSNTIAGHNNSYGVFTDLKRQTEPAGTQWFCFEPVDGSGPLRTAVIPPKGSQIYAGSLPSVRRAREDSARAYDFRMPVVLVRHVGTDLQSIFAAVHEPAATSEGSIGSVRALTTSGAPGAAAILCEGSWGQDLHVFGPGADSRVCVDTPWGPFSLVGRYALVRFRDGRLECLTGIDAQEVTLGERRLAGQAPLAAARVVGVRSRDAGDTENALLLDAPVPAGEFDEGRRAIVRFGDGTTFGLAPLDARTEEGVGVLRLRHRPGFTLSADGSAAEHTHHPHRRMTGDVTVTIPSILNGVQQ